MIGFDTVFGLEVSVLVPNNEVLLSVCLSVWADEYMVINIEQRKRNNL